MSGRSPTHAGAWTPWVPSAVPGGRATLGTSSSSCAESVSKAKLSPKRSQLCRPQRTRGDSARSGKSFIGCDGLG